MKTTQNMMQSHNKKIAYAGILISVGLIMGYLEFLIPLPVGIPGVKLGLSNIITLFSLYNFDPLFTFVVLILRVLLSGLLFGNLFGTLYGLSGAFISFIVMYLVKRGNIFSIVGVSIMGGIFHNIAQLIVACILISQIKLSIYLPVLLLSGLICGLAVGIISQIIINRFHNEKGLL